MHFRTFDDMKREIGSTMWLGDTLVTIGTHAPNESFQAFGTMYPLDAVGDGSRILRALSEEFGNLKFSLQQQKGDRKHCKWVVIFHRRIESDGFKLYINRFDGWAMLHFFAVAATNKDCEHIKEIR